MAMLSLEEPDVSDESTELVIVVIGAVITRDEGLGVVVDAGVVRADEDEDEVDNAVDAVEVAIEVAVEVTVEEDAELMGWIQNCPVQIPPSDWSCAVP